MKKLIITATLMLVAAITLTSCGQQQAETEKEVPLKVTYNIECSKHLLDLCDLVVTYKGDDGVNVVDTITATPADSAEVKDWTVEIQTHKVPVKIGLDYTFVQKSDTLIIDQPSAKLNARCTIIADKIGMVDRYRSTSDKVISEKKSFYVFYDMMDEEVVNTRQNLASIINNYNELQADNRQAITSNTCYIVKPYPNSNILLVRNAPWNDEEAK